MFSSATDAILRYVQLYQLLSTPRSIPLGIKKTHVGKTDSRERWEKIRLEFTQLAQLFPSSGSESWFLLTISVMTNKMQRDRHAYFMKITGKKISRYLFERRTAQAYGYLTANLKQKSLLEDIEAL